MFPKRSQRANRWQSQSENSCIAHKTKGTNFMVPIVVEKNLKKSQGKPSKALMKPTSRRIAKEKALSSSAKKILFLSFFYSIFTFKRWYNSCHSTKIKSQRYFK